MKAGTYYVGDLCYVVKDSLWSELVDLFFEDNKDGSGLFKFKGEEIFTSSTAYGDGIYFDNQGRQYPVDSGSIGCISIDSKLISKKELKNIEKQKLGHIIEFKDDFMTIYGNIITIGNIVIDTDEDEEDEYDF